LPPVTVALVEVFEKHADRGGLPATPLPKTGCVVPAIGVNSTLEFEGDAQRAATVAAIKNVLGAQVVRYGLRWNRIEPVEGEREWSRPDGVVEELRAAGIEPLWWSSARRRGRTRCP
jgi:hypothetical protein